ncbi:hypothetical protein ERJ75_000658800 [Trypanosoma vivax]|nr:hypothetical protein ERJ75_000658800 [Trypanosoma vivax]
MTAKASYGAKMAAEELLEYRKELTHFQMLSSGVQSVLGKGRLTVNYSVKGDNDVAEQLAEALKMEVSILAYEQELESVMKVLSSQLNAL